jgi:proteasome lid subunit RPN8/RPN11
MSLRISGKQISAIGEHGAREYPNECCGVLLGSESGGVKHVSELAPVHNIRHDPARAQQFLPLADPERESERNRFLMDPEELLRIQAGARTRGLDILGYYHSHPDHPARPSEYDREHAWPWVSYVIISIQRGQPGDFFSWVLADDRSRFENEPVVIVRNEADAVFVDAGSNASAPRTKGD